MNIATRKRSSGIVLMAVLIIVFALAVLAATISVMAVTDIKMTAHFKRATEALYEADAAVQYVKAAIQNDLRSGSLTLAGAKESVNYTAPNGMFFDPVTQLVPTADTNAYFFAVTGYSDKARVTVETVFRRASTFDLGLFGDSQLDAKAYGNVYTYDSRLVHDPSAEDTLGGALIASNGDFFSYQDTFIDGTIALGESATAVPGSWRETPKDGSTITGGDTVDTDRVDPDPLGVIGGDLAEDFAYYSISTNNDNATTSEITAPKNKLWLKNGETMTMTAGEYYIGDLWLFEGSSLTIDASSGPVTIYLTGEFQAHSGTTINMIGDPPDLNIFSNSDDPIVLKNQGDFRGLIYAPYAPITVMNNADFYGIAWGEQVEIKNSGDVYIDTALMQEYLSNVIQLLTWKERREG
jgi:hypothetical protein